MGMATTKLQAKRGGGGYRGTFLAVRTVYLQDDASAPLIQDFWLNAKEDAPLDYLSQVAIRPRVGQEGQQDQLPEHGRERRFRQPRLELDMIDPTEFEPSACVVHAGAEPDEAAKEIKLDDVAIWVTHVLRKRSIDV